MDTRQCIAGIEYLVNYPPGIFPSGQNAIEAEFTSRQPSALGGIHVDLVAWDIPDLSDWRMLLSSGPAWSIRRRGAERCLCTGAASDAQPARLMACWNEDASQARVYCVPGWLKTRVDGIIELGNAAGYPVNQLLMVHHLAQRGGILLHAAGLVSEGRGLIFPGVSGAGKSTLSRQFLARGGAGLLSDDRIMVRWQDGAHLAYGTPWPGEALVAVNASAPLAAILFPAKGGETRIRALSAQEALDRLLPVTSMLWHEPELLSGQLESCERLIRQIPAFELSWSPSTGIVDDIHAFIGRL